MRILLATYGSRGDVEPIAALAVALLAQGVDVVTCAPPDDEFARLFARAGVPLTPFRRSWRSWASEGSTAEETVIDAAAHVRGYIDATWDVMAETARGCDGILASGMLHFIARSVADLRGTPLRFALFCPSLLRPQGWQPSARAPIDAHGATLGLAPVGEMHAHLFTERPWLAADTALSPLRDAEDAPVTRSDAWILKDDRPLSDELRTFLGSGPPPVYVGFGSMRVAQDAARNAVEASRAHGRRIVIASGRAGLAAVDQGDDCLVVGEVNQQALFRKVAAVIHHGGAGTTTTAARAGAAQVVVPQAVDQPYWAGRVAALGLGVAHDGPVPTAASLSATLGVALSPETQRKATAFAMRQAPGGEGVAARRLVEEYAVERSARGERASCGVQGRLDS